MRRREFITLLGGAAATWPLVVHAQQSSKLPLIGFAGSGTASTQGYMATAFSQRLGELGRIEGRTVAIEYRWAEGRNERATEIAAEFVGLKVDAIVTVGTPLTMAAKQATSLIPIVFAVVGDPVASGVVSRTRSPHSSASITRNASVWPGTPPRAAPHLSAALRRSPVKLSAPSTASAKASETRLR
jgi:putative tryptophan/tyrosine transport system substrate-binding protein